MITMGIGLVAGVFYWLASYKLAFWILVYAIIYGGLGILRGDNHARPIFRGDSEFTVVVPMPVAWHIAGSPVISRVKTHIAEMPRKNAVRSSVT